MGKKGRPKPKTKQSGKKRSKGKKTLLRRAATTKNLNNNVEDKYFTERSEYEPVREADLEQDEERSEKIKDDVAAAVIDEDQDLDVIRHSGIDFRFLTNLNPEQKQRKKRKAFENIEESYEKKPRLATEEWQNSQHILLPLKAKNGVIQQRTAVLENVDTSNLDETNEKDGVPNPHDADHDENAVTMTTVLSTVDLLEMRQKKVTAKKLLITNLVSDILKDPYVNVEKLQDMNKLCDEKDFVTIRKLAIVSQKEVFKDVIPGYQIRPLSEADNSAKISKDVKKVRKFEQGLLQSYQKYLQILENVIKEKKKYRRRRTKNTQKDLSMIALECLCDLLVSVPRFNFRTNIMTVLVPKMNDGSRNVKISQLCCETITSIFKTDTVGEISLEIVQLISKFVKSQSFKVKPCVLETFLSLRLHDADLSKKNDNKINEKPKNRNRVEKAKKKQMSKNDRKRQKEMRKLEHELQEAEAVEGKQKSRKMQTEIIKLVFAIYFRVLKTSGIHELLTPVLTGLSKYTHLINIDFFGDLMAVLKALVNSEEIRSSDKLHCILTAFKILSGQGEALNIDPQAFYTHLYSTLISLNLGSDMTVALECLDVMLNKRRKQVSIQRLLAYIKRLCTVSLQHCPATSLALLSCARSFLQMDTKTGVILDSDFSGSGIFRPDVQDPEHSNADSTALWELCILCNHYDPTLRYFATNISLGNPSQGHGALPNHLSRKSPVELFEEYNEEKQLSIFFVPHAAPKLQKSQKTSSKTCYPDHHQLLQEEIKKCQTWLDNEETGFSFVKFC